MVDPASALSMLVPRMSDEARQALYFARQKVSDFGSATIEPQHLLLGLVQDEHGSVATLLSDTFHLEVAA